MTEINGHKYLDSQLIEKVTTKYFDLFSTKPEMMVFAPGRVNLIGEHTDYSDGFVLPLAINMGILIALKVREDEQVKLFSLDFEEYFDQEISKFSKKEGKWQEYIKGVAWAFKEAGFDLKGFQGTFAGNLPIGAGLSSSAALEVATAKTFCITSDIDLSKRGLAKICQAAERDWVGVNVGIMDQLISANGKSGHAMMLDCRTLETKHIPIPDNICFVVMDTSTRRELSHSEYNTRHEEVKLAASILGVTHLRDASRRMLINKKGQMPQKIFTRAKHVITENERVHAFGSAMEGSNPEKMGDLLNQSHISLRDDFEVSSRELDIIVEISQKQAVCYGARMTGAGFGGCALALIEENKLDGFTNDVSQSYIKETGITPNIFNVESADGVHAIIYKNGNFISRDF